MWGEVGPFNPPTAASNQALLPSLGFCLSTLSHNHTPTPPSPPYCCPPPVNQALLCTALGLSPAFFCRFSQSNAAFTRTQPPAPAPAVNQALLCTALGLPPAFFRRFSQSNAAFTVLDFEYSGGAGSQRAALPPRVRVERMNQVRGCCAHYCCPPSLPTLQACQPIATRLPVCLLSACLPAVP